jgi:hypothetical protein
MGVAQRWGRGWSSGDRGLLTGKELFLVLLPHIYPVTYKEQPVFEYLDSDYGAILHGPGDKSCI